MREESTKEKTQRAQKKEHREHIREEGTNETTRGAQKRGQHQKLNGEAQRRWSHQRGAASLEGRGGGGPTAVGDAAQHEHFWVGVEGFGVRVWGFGFWGLWFGGFRVWGLGLGWAWGLGSEVWGLWFGVWGLVL